MTAVDNLNRATTISGVNRTYDILGNTLTKGSTTTYTWDVLNRMLSHTASSVTTSYAYRADGMRVTKDNGTTLSRFYYDGQMPIETAEVGSSSTVVTRNGLGARGIDRIERVGTSTTVGYPIYDGHGNMIATLSKSGSSYSVGDLRSYDAWGGIRSGNTTGDLKGRYSASLGHIDDDESALTYMRARYYEASLGRFFSEDRARDGNNWFSYCNNNPINLSDATGCVSIYGCLAMLFGFVFAAEAVCMAFFGNLSQAVMSASLAVTFFAIGMMGASAMGDNPFTGLQKFGIGAAGFLANGLPLNSLWGGNWLPNWLRGMLPSMASNVEAGTRGGGHAVAAVAQCSSIRWSYVAPSLQWTMSNRFWKILICLFGIGIMIWQVLPWAPAKQVELTTSYLIVILVLPIVVYSLTSIDGSPHKNVLATRLRIVYSFAVQVVFTILYAISIRYSLTYGIMACLVGATIAVGWLYDAAVRSR